MSTHPMRGHMSRTSCIGSCLLVAFGTTIPARAEFASLKVVADTFITSAYPANNAGATTWFDAGTDGTGGIRRGLLRFDLSSIPPGSTVTSAVVQLQVIKVPSNGPVDSMFDLFRLLGSWNEGTNTGDFGAPARPGDATWNARKFGTANWVTPGAANDAVPTASASTSVGSALNATYIWTSSNLLSDVQFWVDNPSLNFGWLVMSEAEGSLRSVRGFASRQSAGGGGVLQVGYLPPSPPNQPLLRDFRSPTPRLSRRQSVLPTGPVCFPGRAIPAACLICCTPHNLAPTPGKLRFRTSPGPLRERTLFRTHLTLRALRIR